MCLGLTERGYCVVSVCIHSQSKAEYKRKAAILVELLAAQRNEGGTASEAFMQQLAAFRVDVDEAMLFMLHKRLEAAVQHAEVGRGRHSWAWQLPASLSYCRGWFPGPADFPY